MAEPTVYLGLGSNLAQPRERVLRAREELASLALPGSWHCSRLYESEPWGEEDQAPFVNAVCGLTTRLEPLALLDRLQALEAAAGRRRKGRRWGPRELDLDILAWGDRVLSSDRLTVPHPLLAQRAFVLVPWAEIAPAFTVPGLGTVAQLLDACDDRHAVHPLE